MDNSSLERKRLYQMGINALVGYLIAELGILSARLLNLISISYLDILALSIAVNATSLFFIINLRRDIKLSRTKIRLYFLIQLTVYFLMYGITVIQAKEFRLLILVYAILAVSSLLPFASAWEAFMVSLCSVAAHLGATYYAVYHLGQNGVFLEDMFYTLSFCPTLAMMVYVARQINLHKSRVSNSMELFENMNSELVSINLELQDANQAAINEIELASQLQKSILPEIPGKLHGWDISLLFKPKYGVSGDIYDFYVIDGELKGMSIFDVSGHGISSALLAMIVKPVAFRWFNQMRDKSLSDIIKEVNSSVTREISRLDNYITCIMLRFNGDSVEYANTGHPDLLIRRSGNLNTGIVHNNGNPFKGEPIGINISNVSPNPLEFSISKGDILLIYSDCILESKNPHNETFGMERLIQFLDEAPDGKSSEILDSVIQKFYSFISGVEIKDDFTVILAKKI